MYKTNDLLSVELQAARSWREETEQRLGQMERAMKQSERAMRQMERAMRQMERAMEQMERMMEYMRVENRRAMNIGEEMDQEHEG